MLHKLAMAYRVESLWVDSHIPLRGDSSFEETIPVQREQCCRSLLSVCSRFRELQRPSGRACASLRSFTLGASQVQFARSMNAQALAPITGVVWKILVSVGERVVLDQPIILLESMKMEVAVTAPNDGVVERFLVGEGDAVEDGDPVAVLA